MGGRGVGVRRSRGRDAVDGWGKWKGGVRVGVVRKVVRKRGKRGCVGRGERRGGGMLGGRQAVV